MTYEMQKMLLSKIRTMHRRELDDKGGFVWRGLTYSNRKRYARKARYKELFAMDRPYKQAKNHKEMTI